MASPIECICRGCKAEIYMVRTERGKFAPIDRKKTTLFLLDGSTVQGHMSHFATCPKADQLRRMEKDIFGRKERNQNDREDSNAGGGMSTREEEKRAVDLLTSLMRNKLRRTSYKTGWRNESRESLWRKLMEEARELDYAVLVYSEKPTPQNYKYLLGECADVANFAAMIADHATQERYDAIRTELAKAKSYKPKGFNY